MALFFFGGTLLKQVFFRPEQIAHGLHRPTRPNIARLLGSAFFSVIAIEHKNKTTAQVSYGLNQQLLGCDGDDLRQRMLNHVEQIEAMWEDSFNSPFVILTGAMFDFLSFLDGHTVMGAVRLFYFENRTRKWQLINPESDLQAQFSHLFYGSSRTTVFRENRATPVLKRMIAFLKECCAAHEHNPKGERRFAERLFQHFFEGLGNWQVEFVHLPQQTLAQQFVPEQTTDRQPRSADPFGHR